ncbi:hypothetical protein BGX38DRAFT_1139143 [Terfezia claveryi]|nr:hypothetical protein BGX38DRAFT_1139143 [Terfezia claveryi]
MRSMRTFLFKYPPSPYASLASSLIDPPLNILTINTNRYKFRIGSGQHIELLEFLQSRKPAQRPKQIPSEVPVQEARWSPLPRTIKTGEYAKSSIPVQLQDDLVNLLYNCVINIPEENPEKVAKLMQFLYVGSYTIDEELIPPLPAVEKELDGGDGCDADDNTNLPRYSEDERMEGLSKFRLWNRGRAMPPPVVLPQIATPSGYSVGLISEQSHSS